MDFPSVTVGKESACNAGEAEDTHSSTLAWRIPRTEEPGRLQSLGRKESLTTEATQHTRMHSAYLYQSQSPSSCHLPFPALVSLSLFSMSVAVFLLCK